MQTISAPLVLGFVLGAIVAGAVLLAVFAVRVLALKRTIRTETLKLSRATLRGQLVEQLLPLLPEFNFDASDARFLGAPIDYVVFDGYSEGGDVEIVLLEVKTGGAQLSSGERRIRDAVKKGRVRFETVRVE